jgi:hypothetical protein
MRRHYVAPETASETTYQYSYIFSQSIKNVMLEKSPPDANVRKNIKLAIFEVINDPNSSDCRIENIQGKSKTYWYPVRGTNPLWWISYSIMDSLIYFITPSFIVDFKLE